MSGIHSSPVPVIQPAWHAKSGRFARNLIVIAAAVGLAACVTTDSLSRRVSDSPQSPWKPPAPPAAQAAIEAVPQIPDRLKAARNSLTLADLVDIGLTNNAQTRLAWSAARSAAAAFGVARSSEYPRLELTGTGTRSKAAFAGGKFIVDQTTFSPIATLSYTLFDFGGRGASIDAARNALEAANWTQNAAIQNVILQVEKAYYQYLAAQALLKAQDVSLKSAQASAEAAAERRRAGVATIADVLQAKTALSTTELGLVTAQGLVQTLHGTLANALGLPAQAGFEVADGLNAANPGVELSKKVDDCIREAESRRPDLAAARSLVQKADAQVRKARSDLLPFFTLSGSLGRVYYQGQAVSNGQFGLSVLLDVPLFSGFQREYQILQARADAETAAAQEQKLEQDVALQVWTSYYGLKTAEQKIKAAEDLVASAEESYQVSLGRYKEGVGSILDVLTAQSILENGRGQAIQARTDWVLALVQLAHDTGALGAPGAGIHPGD